MFDSLRAVLRFRKFELNPNRRRLATSADVDDLRRLAKKRLPAGVFDYIDGGAEDELTLTRNARAYQTLGFRPRVLRDMSAVDPSCTLLGRPTPLPLALAPSGFTRIAHPQGELAVTRAAARLGIPYTLSTMGTRSIEEMAAASDSVTWGGDGERRLWFQGGPSQQVANLPGEIRQLLVRAGIHKNLRLDPGLVCRVRRQRRTRHAGTLANGPAASPRTAPQGATSA